MKLASFDSGSPCHERADPPCAELRALADAPQWPLTFYRVQLAAALLVGTGLLALPAVIMEAPEPAYAGETLARRVAGGEAGVLVASVNWALADAAKRGRLGASTFRALNRGAAAATMSVRAAASCHCALA